MRPCCLRPWRRAISGHVQPSGYLSVDSALACGRIRGFLDSPPETHGCIRLPAPSATVFMIGVRGHSTCRSVTFDLSLQRVLGRGRLD